MPETSTTEEQKNEAASGASDNNKPEAVKNEKSSSANANTANTSDNDRTESPKAAELRKKRDELNDAVKKLITESKQSYSGLKSCATTSGRKKPRETQKTRSYRSIRQSATQ